MEELTIRNLDEKIFRELKLIAWYRGLSVEEPVRSILTEAVATKRSTNYLDRCDPVRIEVAAPIPTE